MFWVETQGVGRVWDNTYMRVCTPKMMMMMVVLTRDLLFVVREHLHFGVYWTWHVVTLHACV